MRDDAVSVFHTETASIVEDGIRSFAKGFFSIDIVVIAHDRGFGALSLVFVTGLSVIIGIFITHYSNQYANKNGSRISMAVFGLLMSTAGVIVLTFKGSNSIYLASAFGFLPPSGGLFISALAEGVLAHTESKRRTKVFARDARVVNVMAALGALSAAAPSAIGLSELNGLRLMTAVFVILGIAITLLSVVLVDPKLQSSNLAEEPPSITTEAGTHSRNSRYNINLLTFLFAADSAGSGVVTSTLIIF